MAAVLRVKEPFAFDEANGVQRVMPAGTEVFSDNPCVKGREAFFEPVEVAAGRQAPTAVVEDATAAPGERRSVGRPRKPKGDDDSKDDD